MANWLPCHDNPDTLMVWHRTLVSWPWTMCVPIRIPHAKPTANSHGCLGPRCPLHILPRAPTPLYQIKRLSILRKYSRSIASKLKSTWGTFHVTVTYTGLALTGLMPLYVPWMLLCCTSDPWVVLLGSYFKLLCTMLLTFLAWMFSKCLICTLLWTKPPAKYVNVR